MKIKEGDNVVITKGKDRGKMGKVQQVIPKENRVVVDSVNMIKKHVKPSRNNPKGGIVDQPAPFDISNVKIICPKCQKPTRVGYKKVDSKKLRICKKCQEIID